MCARARVSYIFESPDESGSVLYQIARIISLTDADRFGRGDFYAAGEIAFPKGERHWP